MCTETLASFKMEEKEVSMVLEKSLVSTTALIYQYDHGLLIRQPL